jgi:hypothetical protein
MSDWSASIVKDVDTFLVDLGVQEGAMIAALIVSLVSLCLVFVLLRRRLTGTTPRPSANDSEPSEGVAHRTDDVAEAQAELRELIREFSVLAAQVLRTVDRNQMLPRLPEAGGAALQLLDLGLTPAEAARATGMTMGEVALLMNLRKVKASTLHLPEMSSIGAEESADNVIGENGRSNGRPIEVRENGRQVG